MKKILITLPVAAALIIGMTGCVPHAEKSSPKEDSAAASVQNPDAAEPSFAPTPEVPEPLPTENLAFGDAMTWTDGVALSVSAPVGFTPTEYAAGADQPNNVLFTFVLTNNSDANLEPAPYTRVSSGGVEASSVFDTGNPAGEISGSPSTVILPGQTVSWIEAYSIADVNSITLQSNPSWDYDDAIWTNIK